MCPTSSGRRNAHWCTWCGFFPTTFHRDLNTDCLFAVRCAVQVHVLSHKVPGVHFVRSRGPRDANRGDGPRNCQ